MTNRFIYKVNDVCNYISLPPSAFGDMLSVNQQAPAGANFYQSSLDVNTHQEWYSSQSNFTYTGDVNMPYQISNIPERFNQPANNIQFQLSQTNDFISTNGCITSNSNYAQIQNHSVPVLQTPWHRQRTSDEHQTSNVQSQTFNTSMKKHKASISLVPNSSGGFRTILKRKRKRTMFTTEQVAVLESVFQKTPYVTRENRQILVKNLQLTDTSVKVWFQNRRLRGKRQEIEAAEESYHECGMEDYLYRPEYSERLDHIEHELKQKVNESGYLSLDEKSIQMIVDVVDYALSPDLNLESLSNFSESTEDFCDSLTDSSGCITDSSEFVSNLSNAAIDSSDVCCNSKTVDYIEKKYTCSQSFNPENVSMYEPISPAESNKADEPIDYWQPANDSLKTLFDLHFC